MADVRPFRGIRYDSAQGGDLSLNLCPTYVISTDEQNELYNRSPHNVIRLELAYDWGSDAAHASRYARAAETRRAWLEAGILRRDETPSMYVVEERFSFRDGQYRRIGLLAAVRVEPYEKGIILPHESTEPGPTADRLALMRTARSNFSPLMVLYRDGRDTPIATLLWQIARREPDLSAGPPGQPAVRVWRVTDAAMTGALSGALRDTRLLIADGHHRYQAALEYSDFARRKPGAGPDAASGFRMMTLIEIDDPGLFLLGYHRAVEGASSNELEALREKIKQSCDLRRWQAPDTNVGPAFELEIARAPASQTVFGVVGLSPGAFHVATLRPSCPAGTGIPSTEAKTIDTTDYARLHDEILRSVLDADRELRVVNVKHHSEQGVADVAEGRSQMAFVMRAIPRSVAEAALSERRLLPVKSTYFHPKLSAGLVIQSLEGDL